MEKTKKYFILHLSNGNSIFAYTKDHLVNSVDSEQEYYSANIDQIDTDDVDRKIEFDSSHIVATEICSQERFLYFREMSIRSNKIREIKTLLELQQMVDMGRKAGVIHDVNDQREEESPQQPHKPQLLRSVEPAVNEPIDDEPLGEPAEPISTQPIPPMTIQQKRRDGAVIEIPLPKKQ